MRTALGDEKVHTFLRWNILVSQLTELKLSLFSLVDELAV